MSDLLSESTISLLLTAAINTRNCWFVKRTNPKDRLEDYKWALRQWLQEPCVNTIIFCENTGFDLSDLVTIKEHENVQGKNVTIMSYIAEDPGARGKGYGDMDIIRHAVSHCDLRCLDRILRVTGRYYITNMPSVSKDINKSGVSDIVHCRQHGPWVGSECYCATRRFLEKYFFVRQNEIDDSKGIFVEHVLAASIKEAVLGGLSQTIFSEPPQTVGVSGTFDLSLEMLRILNRKKSTIPPLNLPLP